MLCHLGSHDFWRRAITSSDHLSDATTTRIVAAVIRLWTDFLRRHSVAGNTVEREGLEHWFDFDRTDLVEDSLRVVHAFEVLDAPVISTDHEVGAYLYFLTSASKTASHAPA